MVKQNNKDKNTENRILDAAILVFTRKGFDGARMQEIADEAKINKSLLHYYYRTKDKLFEAVFLVAFKQFMPGISEKMNSDIPLKDKIRFFISSYIDMLYANPHLPIFILNEINRKPNRIINLIKEQGFKPELFFEQIRNQVKKNKIKSIHPQHLIINMLSMCIFPFAARSIAQCFLFNNSKKAYDEFLLERKKEVTNFIIHAITK